MKSKAVMVIHGHDLEANDALFSWLRAIGLEPMEWEQLVTRTGSGSPYIGQVLQRAFQEVQAVIAFFTPDEDVRGRHGLRRPPEASSDWRLESRPNVHIEAGMALVTHPDQTIFVILGPQELPSDLAGLSYIRLDDTAGPLNKLANRLENAGYEIDRTGTEWLNPHRFPERPCSPQAPGGWIDSPAEGDTAVSKWIQVRGGARDVPPGQHLWIAVRVNPGGEFWPKGNEITLDEKGRFDVTVLEEGDSPRLHITLLLVTAEVHAAIHRWFNEANRAGRYPALLPSQYPTIELASICLKRVKDSHLRS